MRYISSSYVQFTEEKIFCLKYAFFFLSCSFITKICNGENLWYNILKICNIYIAHLYWIRLINEDIKNNNRHCACCLIMFKCSRQFLYIFLRTTNIVQKHPCACKRGSNEATYLSPRKYKSVLTPTTKAK